MADQCNVDEIMKQLKVLESLKNLQNTVGDNFFLETFPELGTVGEKLNTVISKQEEELSDKMAECGNLNPDELPPELMPRDLDPLASMESDMG